MCRALWFACVTIVISGALACEYSFVPSSGSKRVKNAVNVFDIMQLDSPSNKTTDDYAYWVRANGLVGTLILDRGYANQGPIMQPLEGGSTIYNFTSPYEVLATDGNCKFRLVKVNCNSQIPPNALWSDQSLVCFMGASVKKPKINNFGFANPHGRKCGTIHSNQTCCTNFKESWRCFFKVLAIVDIDVTFLNMETFKSEPDLKPVTGELVLASEVKVDNRNGSQIQHQTLTFSKAVAETETITTEQSISYASSIKVGVKLGVTTRVKAKAEIDVGFVKSSVETFASVTGEVSREKTGTSSIGSKNANSFSKSTTRTISESVVIAAGQGDWIKVMNYFFIKENVKMGLRAEAVVSGRGMTGQEILDFMKSQGFRTNGKVKVLDRFVTYEIRGTMSANQFADIVTKIELLNPRPNATAKLDNGTHSPIVLLPKFAEAIASTANDSNQKYSFLENMMAMAIVVMVLILMGRWQWPPPHGGI